ncbi:MAG: DNA polymerase III subunit alpha [Firmicutes bacterium]|nr:DNA polymerase III subunit alpha [Bacillota bacterium]
MGEFVHLHCHSEYSLLDGLARTKELVKKAKALNMDAVALTDHGVMFGIIEFYKAAKAEGVKPIVGVEIYVAPKSRFDKAPGEITHSFHLVLLAKDSEGYRNLCKLASIASLEGFYYNPRIDKEVLREYSGGLVGLSACLKGEVQFYLNRGEYSKARDIALEYKDIFAPGDFYLEAMDHGIMEQKRIMPHLIQLSEETGIKIVATNDVHYIEKKDATAHDVLLCIQTGKTYDDPARMKYATDQFYLKSAEEMGKLFPEHPEFISNTLEVAEKCNLKLTLGENILPDFPVPEGFTKESFLEHLTRQGMKRLYGEVTQELEDRLKIELDVINGKGLAAYFLIVWDFINHAKSQGIPVGPGRGSAAGSLMAYCIGITDVDPMKYTLLFERFLNPERISLPDIDTDFCQSRREEVIKYVTEKYGADKVSQIVTFGKMKSRVVIRDVGRVYGVPLPVVDKLAKMVPFGAKLKEALETPDMKEAYESDPQAKKLIDMGIQLEGINRNSSIHAAGVLISKIPITDCAPLYRMKGDEVVVQYDMNYSAEVGLLKMDFLGLRNLTILDDALKIIKKRHGIEIDLLKLPLDDAQTYELLQAGKTVGVFQLESPGMTRYLMQLKPNCVEDIIAMCALYRPGPLKGGMVDEFIKRKHGLTKTKYLHPVLEPILKETYGVIVYQEQVMQIANVVGGYSLGEADELRRAMGKKKAELMAQQRSIFTERAVKLNYDRDLASEIFDYMEAFAAYGFNKAHTACYGIIAYQTAYLKTHYTMEYMAALMTSVMGINEKISLFVKECKNMGIQVMPPDVNESDTVFTVTDQGIRFGLAAVKNVGTGPVQEILKARKAGGNFTDFQDFCCRVANVNKKVIESLILSGAMNCFGETRATLLNNLEQCMEFGSCQRAEKNTGQISLFDDMEGDEALTAPPLKKMPELELRNVLSKEKELLGLYVSDHPLNRYKDILEGDYVIPVGELTDYEAGKKVTIGGLITAVKKKLTKNNQMMAFIEVEDLTGSLEVNVFPKTYDLCSNLVLEDSIVIVSGRLELDTPFSIDDEEEESEKEPVPKITADDIKTLEKSNLPRKPIKLKKIEKKEPEKKLRGVHIRLENNGINLQKLREILSNSPGEEPVFLHCESGEQTTTLQVDSRYFVHSYLNIKEQVEVLLGGGSIWATQ